MNQGDCRSSRGWSPTREQSTRGSRKLSRQLWWPTSIKGLFNTYPSVLILSEHLYEFQYIADRLAQYVQAYTLYSSVRPFGISTILGAVDQDGPALFVVEPSGVYYGYHGAAIGKGRQLAKTEIEKLNLSELTTREAVLQAARMYVSSSKVLDNAYL